MYKGYSISVEISHEDNKQQYNQQHKNVRMLTININNDNQNENNDIMRQQAGINSPKLMIRWQQ